MSDKKVYWIWLNNVPGIGARRFYKLIEYFESPENLYNASEKEFNHVGKLHWVIKQWFLLQKFRKG